MANVTVTMLQSGRTDDWGRPLVAGNNYSLDFDRAKSLWQAGFASVADPTIFDDDNTPNAGGLIRYMRFPGFKKSLLASLVANSTASRVNGLVTITATAHGITTGSTYQGFRFFYPGSANLSAGWYDSIVSIPDANTLTFSAPGPDFASESVNGAAAYTSLTAITSVTIPGGTLKSGSRITSQFFRFGDSTAATKAVRNVFGVAQLGLSTATTGPAATHRLTISVETDTPPLSSRSYAPAGYDGAVWNSLSSAGIDLTIDQSFGLHGSISAAGGFLTIHNASLEIVP